VYSHHRRPKQKFRDEVAVSHSVHAVLGHRIEPQSLRETDPVDIEGVPCQGPAPQRHHIDQLQDVVQSVTIFFQVPSVAQQVVAPSDRLRPLQVRISRHHDVNFVRRSVDDDFDQRADRVAQFLQMRPQPELHVCDYLVVPAAPHVQLRRRFSYNFLEAALVRGVDVFVTVLGFEHILLPFDLDLVETIANQRGLLLAQEIDFFQSRGVRFATFDVFGEHAFVEVDRRVQLFEIRVSGFGKSTTP
jgi:hypothetical protein